MKNQRTYRTKGIFPLAATVIGGTLLVMLGGPFVIDNSDEIFHPKLTKEYKILEGSFDKNKDGELSIMEKSRLYLFIGLEEKSANYEPNISEKEYAVNEFKRLKDLEEINEENVHFKNLEDSL